MYDLPKLLTALNDKSEYNVQNTYKNHFIHHKHHIYQLNDHMNIK